MSRISRFLATVLALVFASAAHADLARDLAGLQQDWARANYALSDKRAALEAFEMLAARAHALADTHPGRAEPLVWEGIVLSTWAGRKGGLGALRLAKQAREVLEAAEQRDPQALDGSVYTSLGALYYKVPGWPVGFGDKDKARTYLQKALEINPGGIDPNWFYGDFLVENGQSSEARVYLERALAAPDRPGRELADAGRRAEIRERLAQLETRGR
jgi:tetratricopeptide (TPR) repeat protein